MGKTFRRDHRAQRGGGAHQARQICIFFCCLLTSLITSLSGLPADWRIASGINGSVYDVDAMLPLSDDVALVLDAEFLL